MERASGSRCMRSQVAPEWAVKEALILVNEIAAVEADCLKALSTHQKWRIISENCTALEVPRTLNQCRRKWDSLLAQYKTATRSTRGPYHSPQIDSTPAHFDPDLFKAIDHVVRANVNHSDTGSDSDPEANAQRYDLIAKLGSKKRRQQSVPVKPQKKVANMKTCSEEQICKSSVEKERKEEQAEGSKKRRQQSVPVKPQKKVANMKTCSEEQICKSSVEKERKEEQAEKMFQKGSKEEYSSNRQIKGNHTSGIKEEEMMAVKLHETAELVHAIVSEKVDYDAAELRNVQDLQSDFVRQQGDKLIECLGEILDTLNHILDDV